MKDLLTPEELEMIATYNAANKLNTFLYKNNDAHRLMKSNYAQAYNIEVDRFDFVRIQDHIARKLTDSIRRFHGMEVIVGGKLGRIEHELTRTFKGGTYSNHVSFRGVDGSDEETIALWVNTGDNYTTHLYNIDKIEVVKQVNAMAST